jgi:hypothetical protein
MRWDKENRRRLRLVVRGATLAGLGVKKITKSPFYREKNSKFVTIPDPNSELWPNRSILAAHYLMMANSENWTKRRLVDRLAEDCGVEVSNSLIRAVRVRLNHATRKKPKKIKIPFLRIPKDIALRLLVLGTP